ncbi:MAG: YkgJ family cysteine cluster protein [Gammaproteobacteria bacterium]
MQQNRLSEDVTPLGKSSPYFYMKKLRFKCTRCGCCCINAGSEFVYLGENEAEKIRKYLGVSSAWFRRRYIKRDKDEGLVLRFPENGRCEFLDNSNRCNIYPVRPGQCKTYPFWRELVTSAQGWVAEKSRCEGIGSGAVVPVNHIENMLGKK